MIRVAMEATGIRRDWKEVAQMGFDTGNGGRVRSYVTHAAMGGCGPMIGIPVESTNELLIMDEAEPVQGAIDEYACDLVDRGRYRDSVLATIELDRGGLFQDWQKRGEELRLRREDVTVGRWRAHAVFEGMRYGLGDKLIYGCDASKRNPETGLPENDCQTEENKGLPLIEFYLDDEDGPLSGLPVATIPAARLLGLDDAAADARKVGLTNRSYPLVAGQEEPALGPREAIAVGRWVEDITKFRFEAHRDPAAFGQMMADRYDLLYETDGLLESYEDVATFDAVNGKCARWRARWEARSCSRRAIAPSASSIRMAAVEAFWESSPRATWSFPVSFSSMCRPRAPEARSIADIRSTRSMASSAMRGARGGARRWDR